MPRRGRGDEPAECFRESSAAASRRAPTAGDRATDRGGGSPARDPGARAPGSIPSSSDQPSARVAVGAQRLGLPARPVEREHELAAQPLAERMLGRECLELRRRAPVPAECQVGVHALLERCQPEFLEPLDLGRANDSYARSASASPRQSASASRSTRAASAGRVAARSPPGPPRASARNVWRRSGRGRPRARSRPARVTSRSAVERLPEPRDLMVEAAIGRAGRAVPPDLVDQPVARHDLIGVQEEDREERPLLRASDGDDAARPSGPRAAREA